MLKCMGIIKMNFWQIYVVCLWIIFYRLRTGVSGNYLFNFFVFSFIIIET